MTNQILLYNAGILTMDKDRRMFHDGGILIQDNLIQRISRSADLMAFCGAEVQRVDLRGRWILPGLINTHVHTSQQLGRGLADDVDLLTWLRERIWPYESNLTEEDSYISSLLCGLELIRSGVTCFGEAGGQYVPSMARAVSELGLRAALCRSTMDIGEGLPSSWKHSTREELEAQISNYERWNGKAQGRIRVWFGLRTIFNNSDELITRTKEWADRFQTGIHMHVAEVKEEVEYALKERGATTVRHLNDLGVLDHNLLAVHSVWLDDEEIDLLAQKKVKVSHNPAAAMHVLGFARVPDMIEAGICVGLGTDGAPANNRMNLIDDMWLASLIHKGRRLDPTVLPAQKMLEMVTCDGAHALLWDEEIGSLEEGKKADLVVINPASPSMLPMHDPVSNMVYAMHSDQIEDVMCDGRWLLRQRKILTVNEEEVIHEARRLSTGILQRSGIRLPQRFPLVD